MTRAHLSRLELIRFGRFQDAVLEPTCAPGRLTLIFGPNEAGKSTTLEALISLFYGFDARTSYDFRFAYKDLRIAGVLRDAEGREQKLVRRKGKADTLLDDASGAVLNESAWAPLLGGVDRALFQRLFGLNAQRLRDGGEALLTAEGDADRSLAEAAGGLAQIGRAAQQLEARAQEVWKKRGANPALNKALAEQREAEKAAKAALLRKEDWRRLQEAVEQAQSDHRAAQQADQAADLQRRRLERLKQARPALAELDRLSALRAALGVDAPPPDLDALQQRWRAAEKALQDHETAIRRDAADLAALDAEIAAIDPLAAVAAADAAIQELTAEAGEARKTQADLPRRDGEAQSQREELNRVARALGYADAAAAAAERPADDRVAAAGQAAQALTAEQARYDDARAAADRAAQQRAAAVEERDRFGPIPDPAPRRRGFDRLRAPGDWSKRALKAQRDAETAQRQAEAAAARLKGLRPGLDPATLAAPLDDVVDRFAASWADGEKAQAAARDALADANRRVAAAEQNLRRWLAAGAPPSEQDLRDARAARDRALAAWAASPDDQTARAKARAAITEADQIADRRFAAADAAAQIAVIRVELDAAQADRDAAEQVAAQAAADHAALSQAWIQEWAELVDQPAPPQAMKEWLGRWRDARAAAERAALAAADAAQAAQDRADAADDLAGLLESWDEPVPAAAQTPEELAAAAEEALRRLETARKTADRAAQRAEDADQAALDAAEIAADAQRRLERAQTAWRAQAAALGLSDDAAPEQAAPRLSLWRDFAQRAEKLEALERRCALMRQDLARFEAAAAAVAARLALPPELRAEAGTVARAAAKWREECLTAQKLLADKTRRCDALRADLAAARTALTQAERALAEIATAAAVAPDQAPARLAAFAQAAELDQALRREQKRLIALAEGVDLDRLRADCAALDPDAAAAELLAAEQAAVEARAARDRAAQALARAQDALAAADDDAERRRQESRAAAAQAQAEQLTRVWAEASLGGLLLRRALDQLRDRWRGPLLTRAEQLFSQLTLGGFTGFATDFDKEDRQRLFGLRPDGEKTPPQGMSEGARDQLFLALRLAAVEARRAQGPAPPFIADDLFASFDDARAVAGLRALADLAQSGQTWLFTHHQHVVELAQTHLGDRVEVLRLPE